MENAWFQFTKSKITINKKLEVLDNKGYQEIKKIHANSITLLKKIKNKKLSQAEKVSNRKLQNPELLLKIYIEV